MLTSSYAGVFVDEYQDCSKPQHEVIKALADYLPICLFGDPLQAIFDFKGQKPVDWEVDVFPIFAKVGELSTPWRWKNVGNAALANWLKDMRRALENGEAINLAARPGCVKWQGLPSDPGQRQAMIVGSCKTVLGQTGNGNLIVIGDAANINARASLAQKLASVGFSTIEPLACANLYVTAQKIGAKTGGPRLEAAMDFVSACMTGADRAEFGNAVKSHLVGRKAGAKKFGSLVKVGVAVVQSNGTFCDPVLSLLEGFHSRSDARLYRREMFYAMRAALRIASARPTELTDAIWEVQNQLRHAGREIPKRCIGSTLLVKGLEFDRAVVIHADTMTRKDWYVALTRATTGLTILSPTELIKPVA